MLGVVSMSLSLNTTAHYDGIYTIYIDVVRRLEVLVKAVHGTRPLAEHEQQHDTFRILNISTAA